MYIVQPVNFQIGILLPQVSDCSIGKNDCGFFDNYMNLLSVNFPSLFFSGFIYFLYIFYSFIFSYSKNYFDNMF